MGKIPIFNVSHEALRMTAQQVLEMRSSARSIESACSALLPLIHNGPRAQEWDEKLKKCRQRSVEVSNQMEQLYGEIAQIAFSDAEQDDAPLQN